MRPQGALVVGRRGRDHGSGLRAVAQLHRGGGEGGCLVEVAAAFRQVGEELSALPKGGGPADGTDIFPENGPVM